MRNAIPWPLPLALLLLCAGGCSSSGGGGSTGDTQTIGKIYEMTLASLKAGHLDSDGDGIPDDVEAILGTDPHKADTDGDGIFDAQEVFGTMQWKDGDPLPDANHDGRIAAISADDDGDGQNDGDKVDSDGDGIPDYMELYGWVWDPLTGKPKLWDGSPLVRYYKTDPYQKSTDQDPFDDLTEVSGVNMDVSVKGPGDLPMVPALPEIVVRMEGYRVTLNDQIDMTQGHSLEKGTSWESSSEARSSNTTEQGWEIGYESEVGFSATDITASVKFHANYSGSVSNTHETSTSKSNGGSMASTEEWSRAVSHNPTQSAVIKLFLKVYNQGSACASNVVPTMTLCIGGHNVATFQPGATQVNLLEPGGTYPQAQGVYWVVDTNQNGQPIYLTENELRALESGAPVSLTMIQMSADVMRKDPVTGAYSSLGDWGEYRARCKAVSANLYFDVGDGNFVHSLVYADNRVTAPRTTLGDAFLWAVGGLTNQHLGVTYTDMQGLAKQVNLEDWTICVDGGTYDANGFGRGVPLPAGFNIFDLRLNANSVVIAKAPRTSVPGATDEPDISYAYFDSGTGGVNAVVGDYNGVASVAFVDKDQNVRPMTQDIPGSMFFTYYPQADSKSYPNGYAFSGTELVQVTNVNGLVAKQTLSGLYVPPKPTPPTIQWVAIDKQTNPAKPRMEAEVLPGVGNGSLTVMLFSNNASYNNVTLKPVEDTFRHPYRWEGSMEDIPEEAWGLTELVAIGGPELYSTVHGPFEVQRPLFVGLNDLYGYFGWWWTDDWSTWSLDLETGLVYGYGWDEGTFPGDDYPKPPAAYDLYLVWHNDVRWEFRFNASVLSRKVALPYDGVQRETFDDPAMVLSYVRDYEAKAGDVYLIKTSSGHFAKLEVVDAVGYDPSGACNRGMRSRVKYTVYAN